MYIYGCGYVENDEKSSKPRDQKKLQFFFVCVWRLMISQNIITQSSCAEFRPVFWELDLH